MKTIKRNTIKNKNLISQLITLVFNKVAEESNETSGYGLSKYLFKAIDEKITERTLIRYYDGYVLNKENEKKKPNAFNLNLLSQYLGFDSFSEFSNQKKSKSKNFGFKLNKKPNIISTTIIAGFIGYLGYNNSKQNCMVWVNNTHYYKITCNEKGDIQSIPMDSYLLNNFKRIVPDSTYPFFKIDGKENLWYEKNSKGQLEFFTSYGTHPITGETLKKITPYMIKKYIWKGYK
ncbi:hypothetical protein [Olleya sp. R77988]|uniref:hypothetical protein n=1 Tax=Olleya sp. R77988 TaxID=3093875 RepID=UPI0037C94A06